MDGLVGNSDSDSDGPRDAAFWEEQQRRWVAAGQQRQAREDRRGDKAREDEWSALLDNVMARLPAIIADLDVDGSGSIDVAELLRALTGERGDGCVRQVFVKMQDGKTHEVMLASTDTVRSFKRKLSKMVGAPPARLLVLFAGENLEDDKTLSQYGVQAESAVHLIVRPTQAGEAEGKGEEPQTEENEQASGASEAEVKRKERLRQALSDYLYWELDSAEGLRDGKSGGRSWIGGHGEAMDASE